jgi:hypothetical protein
VTVPEMVRGESCAEEMRAVAAAAACDVRIARVTIAMLEICRELRGRRIVGGESRGESSRER